jgi:fluoride exporter|tara:strand:+ start:767 stop:1141 length:375 start_codon:yes stop_codon:yes gene_type:complete
MLNLLLIALGGAIGSVCRYALSQLFPWQGNGFPTATFLSNIFASLILGILLGLLMNKFSEMQGLKYFAIIGFCGGFSTFSTFALESFKLSQNGAIIMAILYAIVSFIVSVGLLYGGYSLSSNLN